jgi:DNA-binding transcriptional ArsR family regulator
MVYRLRARELNVSQIAADLQKTPQAIYHQINKLLEAGMVEVVKEERTENFIETYYKATAEVFEFSYGKERGEGYAEQQVTITLRALSKMGLKVEPDKSIISALVGILQKVETIGARPEMEATIDTLESLGYLCRQDIAKYVRFLLMSDKQFESWVSSYGEFRKLLQSSLREPIDRRLLSGETESRVVRSEIDETKRPVIQDYGL